MEGKELTTPQELQKFAQRNLLTLILGCMGITFVIFGLFEYFQPKSDLQFVSSEDVATNSADLKATKISVDVEGQVENPGVYQLLEFARVQDALIAAGGVSKNADRVYVSKNINLAQKVSDGQKLYIPSVDETQNASSQTFPGPQSSSSVLSTSTGLININSASEQELESLPKIGPVTAQKIIDGRPYNVTEDLVSKKVLGQKTFDALKDKITAQ